LNYCALNYYNSFSAKGNYIVALFILQSNVKKKILLSIVENFEMCDTDVYFMIICLSLLTYLNSEITLIFATLFY